MNKKLEQALEINNLNYEHFLTYCKKNKLNPNKISTRENFFREILENKLFINDNNTLAKRRIKNEKK